MIVGLIEEMTVFDVADRGVPNQERIVIRANGPVSLGRYGLMLGVKASFGSAFPIRDNLLWFGDAALWEGDWLFVYTGPGESRVSQIPNTNGRIVSVHWGRAQTILQNQALVPILFRLDAVQVPAEQTASASKAISDQSNRESRSP
jgi:hypothetical protein